MTTTNQFQCLFSGNLCTIQIYFLTTPNIKYLTVYILIKLCFPSKKENKLLLFESYAWANITLKL